MEKNIVIGNLYFRVYVTNKGVVERGNIFQTDSEGNVLRRDNPSRVAKSSALLRLICSEANAKLANNWDEPVREDEAY